MPEKVRYITDRESDWYYWARFSNPYPSSPPQVLAHITATRKEHLQESYGHPIQLLGRTSEDVGGDFKVTKHWYHEGENSQPRLYGSTQSSSAKHLVGQWAYASNVGVDTFPLVTGSSRSALRALGTTAIARTAPTNPVAGLSTFIGEMREGIPRLVGADFFKGRTSLAKSAGSEYLNREFGWLPLLSDVRKFTHVVKNSKEITDDYVRRSGTRIKRRFKFPVESSVEEQDLGAQPATPLLTPTGFYWPWTGKGTLTLVTSTKTERWFKGCFTYYLPKLDASNGNAKRNAALRNKLYGTRVTPEVLWNLAPWSWAADWFANTGDIFHNVSAFASDGLVMPYGYMMETVTVTKTYTLRDMPYTTYGNETFTQSFSTTVKQRRGATPYGFGLAVDAFSNRQLAIIAALGLSKGG